MTGKLCSPCRRRQSLLSAMLAKGMPDVIRQIHISWDGFFLTLVILIALLFVRRLLPPDRRRRGRVALVFLALSLVLRLASGGMHAMELKDAATVIAFLAVLFEAF